MSNDELKVQVTLTEPVRVSWPQVFEPRAVMINGKATGEPFFSARLIFGATHADIQGLRTTASKLLAKVNPGSTPIKDLAPYKDFFYPFKSGATMIAEAKKRTATAGKEYRGFEDYMDGTQTLFAKAAAKYPPQLDVFLNGNWVKLVTPENRAMHKDKFYNGMIAVGSVTLAGVRLPTGGWGVTCYLNGLAALEGGHHIGQQPIEYGYRPPAEPTVTHADDDIPL